MFAVWQQAFSDSSARKAQNFFALLVIIAFLLLSFTSMLRIAETYDEIMHFRYGQKLLSGDAARAVDGTMPISMWNALPALGMSENIFTARGMTLLFTAGLAFGVFYIVRSFYGFLPALFSLFFFCFDPNILAHAQLITTDMYAAGALLLVIFRLRAYLLSRTWKNTLLLGLSFGFAQITKYTALSYFFVAFLVVLLYETLSLWRSEEKNWQKVFFSIWGEHLKKGLVIVFIALLVLNAAYLFQGSLTPFGEYTFQSELLSALQENDSLLNRMPVPVPYAHLQGFDWTLEHERTGKWHGNLYLLGKISELEGFPAYFIVAFFLKVPLTTQILLLLAFVGLFKDGVKRETFLKNEFFFLVPIIFYFIYFNFFYNTQIGIRHYLIIFPLLFVLLGRTFLDLKNFSTKRVFLLGAGTLFFIASVLSYYPYYIPYFNEMIGDRQNAYLYLADSNLDWGQGYFALDEYLAAHPAAIYEPENPGAGLIVVSPNALVGVTEAPDKYAWLRENFEPTDLIAYEYLVYDISPAEFEENCLQIVNCP